MPMKLRGTRDPAFCLGFVSVQSLSSTTEGDPESPKNDKVFGPDGEYNGDSARASDYPSNNSKESNSEPMTLPSSNNCRSSSKSSKSPIKNAAGSSQDAPPGLTKRPSDESLPPEFAALGVQMDATPKHPDKYPVTAGGTALARPVNRGEQDARASLGSDGLVIRRIGAANRSSDALDKLDSEEFHDSPKKPRSRPDSDEDDEDGDQTSAPSTTRGKKHRDTDNDEAKEPSPRKKSESGSAGSSKGLGGAVGKAKKSRSACSSDSSKILTLKQPAAANGNVDVKSK